jgi:hypothetical protein
LNTSRGIQSKNEKLKKVWTILTIKMSEFDRFYYFLKEEQDERERDSYTDTIKQALETCDLVWLQTLIPVPEKYKFTYRSNSDPAREAMKKGIRQDLPDLAEFLLENQLITLTSREQWTYRTEVSNAIKSKKNETILVIADYILRLGNKAQFFTEDDLLLCAGWDNLIFYKKLLEIDQASGIIKHNTFTRRLIDLIVVYPNCNCEFLTLYLDVYPESSQPMLYSVIGAREEALLRLLLEKGADLRLVELNTDPSKVFLDSVFQLDISDVWLGDYSIRRHGDRILDGYESDRSDGYDENRDESITGAADINVYSSYNRLLLAQGYNFYAFYIQDKPKCLKNFNRLMKIRAWSTLPLLHERLKVYEQKRFNSEGCLLDMKSMLECITSF